MTGHGTALNTAEKRYEYEELQRLIKAREGKPGYGPNVKHAKQMLAELDAKGARE